MKIIITKERGLSIAVIWILSVILLGAAYGVDGFQYAIRACLLMIPFPLLLQL